MVRLRTVGRRDFLASAASAAALAALITRLSPASAQQKPEATPLEAWEVDLRRIIGDAQPVEGRITLEMPEVAENGNTVPFQVAVESPMTETDYVNAVHIIATGNPQPLVGTYRFTPASGLAAVSSRMRLAKSQELVVVAHLSDGTFAIGRRMVKVKIACCGL